jgi:HlyD family secretion protein
MDLKKIITKIDKRIILIFSGVVLVIFIALILVKTIIPGESQIPLAAAVLKPLKVDVEAVGQLDSIDAITISSELKGEVKIIYLIEEGTKVKKGDILVRFDSKSFEEKVSALSAKVEEGKALVNAHKQLLEWEKNQATQEIKTAEFDFTVAQLELQKLEEGDGPLELSRLEEVLIEKKTELEKLTGYLKDLRKLEKKGYSYPGEISMSLNKMEKLNKEHEVAKQKYETYKNFFLPTSIETAKAKVERAKMIAQQTQKGVGFKIGKATAEYTRAKQESQKYQKELEYARQELEKTVIKSPQEGLVVMKETFQKGEYRKPRVGDIVFTNQPILFLPDVSRMMVEVLIREVDLSKVKIGKKVSIKVDAYPDLKLTGKVSLIGALAERRKELMGIGEKYFKINILVSEKEESLRPGMTARVKIAIREEKKEVLTVPINAVFQEEGNYFVYVSTTFNYQKRSVQLGMQNLGSAEILKGLKAGEMVCLEKPRHYKE